VRWAVATDEVKFRVAGTSRAEEAILEANWERMNAR